MQLPRLQKYRDPRTRTNASHRFHSGSKPHGVCSGRCGPKWQTERAPGVPLQKVILPEKVLRMLSGRGAMHGRVQVHFVPQLRRRCAGCGSGGRQLGGLAGAGHAQSAGGPSWPRASLCGTRRRRSARHPRQHCRPARPRVVCCSDAHGGRRLAMAPRLAAGRRHSQARARGCVFSCGLRCHDWWCLIWLVALVSHAAAAGPWVDAHVEAVCEELLKAEKAATPVPGLASPRSANTTARYFSRRCVPATCFLLFQCMLCV